VANDAALFSVGLFCVLVVSVAVYLISVVKLLSRLRQRYPTVYESLGSPSLFTNNSPRNNLKLLGWLYRRDYSDLGDIDTERSADRVRFMLLVTIGAMVTLLMAYIVFGVSIYGAAV
jgi:hypothetical protein